MSTIDKEGRGTLEREVEALKHTELPATEAKDAADRVWHRLAGTAGAPVVAGGDTVLDCGAFAAMIAAYRDRTLPAARRELFEDHVRGCVSCRRALWQAGSAAKTAVRPELAHWAAWKRWAAAAAVVVAGLGVANFGVIDRLLVSQDEAQMVAERVDGTLFRVDGAQPVPIRAAEVIAPDQAVRTGRGSRAVLRLADGSRIEVNEHSELSVEARRAGTVIGLKRGSVIVEAAKQAGRRRLFVAAPDCEVAVKGTIFAVSHGPKGSRVAVAEGEVWVEHGGAVTKLTPGQQTATQVNIAPVPVADEFAWSAQRERYAALLHELSEVSDRMAAKLAAVPTRYDSRLLSLLPADTFVYAAAPNVTGELATAGEDLLRRIEASPQLAQWLATYRQSNPHAPDLTEVLSRFRALGAGIGDEVVIGVAGAPAGAAARVVLLAEVRDQTGLRAAIELDLQRVRSECGEEIPVVLVTDPASLSAATSRGLFVWVGANVAVASSDAAEIVRLAGGTSPSGFAATPFFAQLARSYSSGVTWLVAADLARVTAVGKAGHAGDTGAQVAADLGLTDVQYLLVEHKRTETQSQLRGVLTFAQDRRGVPAWLGAPAPMGSLEFISPNAYVAACVLAKEPREIADEVMSVLRQRDPEGFGKLLAFEQDHSVNLRDDLAGPLGGEFLFAIDGPVLPAPAWRAVVLVEDQARLQATIGTLLAEANRQLAAEGRPGMSIEESTDGGVTFYRVSGGGQTSELHYTFADGYWLLAPDRLALKDALRTRQSGLTLASSAEFRRALPVDGQEQYSGLVYVNSGTLGSALASAVQAGAAAAGQPDLAELKDLLAKQSIMAFCVTAERDRIVVTGTGLDLLNPGPVLEAMARAQLSSVRRHAGEVAPGARI
jgi:hypothetical protein